MQAKEQNISPIKQRILEFASTLGISKRDFYANIGVSRGTLESKTGITEDVVAKFIAKYPEVSPEWLLTGKGDTLKQPFDSNAFFGGQTSPLYHPTSTRPRIPYEAQAGSLSLVAQSATEAQCEKLPLITRFPRYDFTIIVQGESMEPNFKPGDEVACQMLRESSYIKWGHPYIIDSIDGVVLKRIYDAGDKILCVSDNSLFGKFEIPKSEINHLALVVGLIRFC